MPHGITKDDLLDADVVDAGELASDGTVVYKTGSIVHASGSYLTASFPAVDIGFNFYTDPAQIGHGIVLSGSGNSDGFYYVAGISADNIIQITGSFSGSAQGGTNSGSWSLVFPPGAENVGFNPVNINPVITTAHDVQRAIHDIGVSLGTGVVTGVPPNYIAAELDSVQSTTSTAYQTALTASITSAVAGTYVVFWYIEGEVSSTNTYLEMGCDIDGTDGIGDLTQKQASSNAFIPFSGQAQRVFASGSNHTISLKYRNPGTGSLNTVTVQRARIVTWRVK